MLVWTAVSSSMALRARPLQCPCFMSSRSWPHRFERSPASEAKLRGSGRSPVERAADVAQRERRLAVVAEHHEVMGVVDRREAEDVDGAAVAVRHDDDEREEEVGNADVGASSSA